MPLFLYDNAKGPGERTDAPALAITLDERVHALDEDGELAEELGYVHEGQIHFPDGYRPHLPFYVLPGEGDEVALEIDGVELAYSGEGFCVGLLNKSLRVYAHNGHDILATSAAKLKDGTEVWAATRPPLGPGKGAVGADRVVFRDLGKRHVELPASTPVGIRSRVSALAERLVG